MANDSIKSERVNDLKCANPPSLGFPNPNKMHGMGRLGTNMATSYAFWVLTWPQPMPSGY